MFRGPNAERWAEKIQTNQERDRRNSAAVEAQGWGVLRIWECEIRSDAEAAARRVAEHARAAATGSPDGGGLAHQKIVGVSSLRGQ